MDVTLALVSYVSVFHSLKFVKMFVIFSQSALLYSFVIIIVRVYLQIFSESYQDNRGDDMRRYRFCERKPVVYICEWHTMYLVLELRSGLISFPLHLFSFCTLRNFTTVVMVTDLRLFRYIYIYLFNF